MTLHLIKITLLDIEPEIWRRILVPSNITMATLHEVIQAAMGWHEAHLHDFVIGDEHFGFEDEDGELPWETHNEEHFKLGDLVKEGDKFSYQYDFGDDWQHELVVERVIKKPKGMVIKNALCLDGARACPPEDCGGPPGYENVVRVLADEDDEEHSEMREWVGNWDAEVFEIDRINKALADGFGR